MLSTEKAFLTQHLALMIKGGNSLPEALEILKNEAKSKSLKNALSGILKRILEGETLAGAMSYYPKIFDKFYQNVVRVGEEAGSLEENFKYLALKIKKDQEMKGKVLAALSYPLIVVFLALFLAFGISFFVLPQITNVLKLLQVELPLATKALISFSVFSKQYWVFILSGIIFLVFLFKAIKKIKGVQFFIDSFLLKLPIFGKISKNLNLSFFSRTFYILLKSGVPLAESLEILSETMPSEVYKRNLIFLKAKINQGQKISQALKVFPKNFPAVFSSLVLAGEKSGTLEESLSYLADYYESAVDSDLKNLANILEPVLLILVGILVAFVAFSIIVPIYKFTGQLRLR